MRQSLPDYVKLDNELALLLVQDFFSIPGRAAYMTSHFRGLSEEITKAGFRPAKMGSYGPGSPPYRKVADIMVGDLSLAVAMASEVHNDDPADSPKLGPRRVERIAAEHGGRAALWAAVATAFFPEKSSATGFKRAVELAREIPGDMVGKPPGGKSAPAPERSAEKEFKQLKKELSQTTKQRDQWRSAKVALEQKHNKAREALRQERDLRDITDKRLAEAQESLGAAESRAGDAEARAGALAEERDGLTKACDSLANERDALALERDVLANELKSAPAVAENPVPEPPISASQDLEAVKSALGERLRECACSPILDTKMIGALAGAIECLDQVIGLNAAAEPEPALSEVCLCVPDSLTANPEPLAAPTGEGGGPSILSPPQNRAWDMHNAKKLVEGTEARIMAADGPAKIILDAHNVILRNFASEADGRELLKETAPIIAERTGAEVYVIFDTKYRTGTEYGPNCRFVYASQADGKADTVISELAWAAIDKPVLIFSDDIGHVVADAHDAAREGNRVTTMESGVMADYVRALALHYRGASPR